MPANTDQHQVDIFQDDQRQRHFGELCNALYERELRVLSQQSNLSLLQRRLAGLSQHVKNIADLLLKNQGPLQVDIHNGSWQAKQAAKSVASKVSAEDNRQWFSHYAKLGMVVAVHVWDLGIEHLELDSIDRIDTEGQRLHLNKHRWFSYDGSQTGSSSEEPTRLAKTLLKPSKVIFTAACCGHSWNHKGRTQPRALSLRELILSTTINWKTFR
jgi:hypothetical protein